MTQIHHQYAVRNVFHHREVMRNEDQRQSHFTLQFLQQVNHLRLNRDVQRRDGLVTDNQLRLKDQGAGDTDTLALTKSWTNAERDYLRAAAPKTGLQTPFRNGTLQDVCKALLDISEAGLKRQNVLNVAGQNEAVYLEPLKEIVSSGLNWSKRLVQQFNGPWQGNISHLFNEMDYARSPSVLTAAPVLKKTKVFLPKLP